MSKKYLAKSFHKENKQFIAKAADLKADCEDVIDLSVGDPDLITANSIINDAAQDAKSGYTYYTHPKGDKELRQEIIYYYQKNYGVSLNMEEIMVTVGACHGTFLALASVLNNEEEVIIPSPYFTPYKEQVKLAGGEPVFLKTDFDQSFQIDTNRLEKIISDKTKVILINSPHNPTGVIQEKENLKKILDLARQYDLLIFSDEVYEVFDYQNRFHSFINFREAKKRIVVLNSFSKIFSMTGWRVGFTIAPPEIINTMQEINEGICYSAPSISQRAAISALKKENKIKKELSDIFKERVFYAWERINKNEKFQVLSPEGTFYLYVNIKDTVYSSKEFVLELLKKQEVFVLPGEDFGDKSGEFIRIACTVNFQKMKEAFDRINYFVENQ